MDFMHQVNDTQVEILIFEQQKKIDDLLKGWDILLILTTKLGKSFYYKQVLLLLDLRSYTEIHAHN